jgi:carbamoyl-phosphate synthase large subunit
MSKVLVSALGTLSGSFISKFLKKEHYTVIGTDIFPAKYIPASIDIDLFIQVPSVVDEEEKYFSTLISICKKYKIQFVIPIIDEEILLLARENKFLNAIGIIPLVPEFLTVKICRDKKATFDFIAKNVEEVNTKTYLLKNYNNTLSYPVFIKPRQGRASIGCQKLNSEEILMVIKNNSNGEDYIVQEFIQGKFISVDFIYYPRYDKFSCILKEELLRNKNGVGTVIKIVHDDFIENICKKIVRLINYKGVGNMEFIIDEKGVHLIEIDPRFPAGTEISVLAGIDLVNDLLKIHQDNYAELSYQIKYDTVYARHYEVYDMGKFV